MRRSKCWSRTWEKHQSCSFESGRRNWKPHYATTERSKPAVKTVSSHFCASFPTEKSTELLLGQLKKKLPVVLRIARDQYDSSQATDEFSVRVHGACDIRYIDNEFYTVEHRHNFEYRKGTYSNCRVRNRWSSYFPTDIAKLSPNPCPQTTPELYHCYPYRIN